MATNTTNTFTNHTGNGTEVNFSISFSYILTSDIDVTVAGEPKTLGTHYTISGSTVTFTSGNVPANGAVIKIARDTSISTKAVDFQDGSVLTEQDLDNNTNQILFAQQEFTTDFVKRDGTQTVTGDLIFEGSADDANETTLAITNPTADRTITVPDITGTLVTTGDTGTVAHTMLANDAVDGDNIADDSINSEHYADVSIDTQHIANENITTAKLANDAVTSSKLADNSVNSEHYVDGSIDHEHLANDIIDGDNIQDDVINSEHYVAGSIDHEHLANDVIDGDNIQNDVINSEHYVAGSIDHEHLANDIIDGDNVQDNAINNEHIAANAVRVNEIKDGEITSAKLNPSTVITASEQASATTNDTSFLTSAAADARFFNISTGDTIKDGDTFPDNDTTIATTAAINDRIIDLIDDVGGFTIIASEQAFPDVNPQGTTGQAAVLSIKAATTNLVPSGTTLTITNGNVANNQDITITGVTSTIPSGFGFLVESTTTLHTYTFHRLVPKATEVTTVAGKAVEIGRLGTADAVADMAILGTTDVVADMNTLAVTDVISDMNTLATADVVSDMNTLAVADVISDMDTVATNVTNVNNVGNNVTNVNSVSNSAGANQTFTVTVQNVSGNKYFIDGVQTPVLKLARGKTYTFNLADSSNSGHPLAFRDSSDNSYTTGVTTSGTAGSSGATVVIVVAANAPNSLKYYCTSHGNAMGNTINVIDDNVGAVAGALTNVNIVGGAITNVNNVSNSISNVNTVASNISSVNSFSNTYRIGSSNPTDSLDVGDLFFNTTANELKVYNGSSWQSGVTATGNFAVTTGNTFTGSNNHNDNVKSIYGAGSDLQIYHSGSHSFIQEEGTGSLYIDANQLYLRQASDDTILFQTISNGEVRINHNGNERIRTESAGVNVTGNISVSGNVDGRDVAADGTKLDGIESNSTADQTASEIVALIADQTIAPSAIDMEDNEEIRLGNSDDLKIYHTSNHSYIKNVTNELRIGSNFLKLKNDAFDEDYLTAEQNGAVELYFDNVKKFETTSGGVDVNGSVTADDIVTAGALLHEGDTNTLVHFSANDTIQLKTNGSSRFLVNNSGTSLENGNLNVNGNRILIGDSSSSTDDRLCFGESQDLQIYHDGSQSVINSITGGLEIKDTGGFMRIRSNELKIQSTANETYIEADANGAVQLFYDNSKKFETVSNGIKVHGHYFADDGNIIQLGTSQDLQIRHDGTDTIFSNSTGDLYINNAGTNSDDIIISAKDDVQIKVQDGETGIQVIGNGGVELYNNNSKKFETYSGGVRIHGELLMQSNHFYINDNAKLRIGTGQDLQIYHSGSHSFLDNSQGDLYLRNNFGTGDCIIQAGSSGDVYIRPRAGEDGIKAYANGAVELYHDNSKKFETTSGGVNVTGAITVNGSALGSGGLISTDSTSSYLTSGEQSLNTTYALVMQLQITPSSSSNKVCIFSTMILQTNGGTSWGGPAANNKLTRTISGGSETTLIDRAISYQRDNVYATKYLKSPSSIDYMDSPNTTSQITYKLYAKVSDTAGSGSALCNTSIAMEVAV